ncbi:MAG: PQQ-dependent sugar dehydrogenase [Pseudomonadota bacterium]
MSPRFSARTALLALPILAMAACAEAEAQQAEGQEGGAATGAATSTPFTPTELARFDEPWAMTFLPDGSMLVTEQAGTLRHWKADGSGHEVGGVPAVDYGGQGGLGDIILHPDFAENATLYLSYVEAGEDDTRGAAVMRARFTKVDGVHALTDKDIIWRQAPKVTGRGHFGHRLAFGPDGMLYISSGERQKFEPAQDMQMNLGKIIRLTEDGDVPPDNPFADQGGVTAEIWSFGHRNPLGIAFAADGSLWEHEMGPKGGDELNLIVKGDNYGYPRVSNGDHYDGRDIPDHSAGDGYNAPEADWTPVISPAGLVIVSGDAYPDWQGTGLIGGLSSKAIVQVALDDDPREIARYDMGERIREIEESADGTIYVLEDGENGRLLALTPKG